MRSSLPHLLKQKESSLQVVLGNRREFLSGRELPYLLVSRLFLKKMEATLLLARVQGDRAPPASKKKNPLPHLRQEETRASCQQSRQAPPIWRERRELRLPLSQQKTSCLALLARGGTELLTISSSSSEDGREFTLQKKACYSPDLQEEKKSGPPPLPSLRKREDEHSTCLAHPFIFSGDDALENFQSQGKSPSCFLAMML